MFVWFCLGFCLVVFFKKQGKAVPSDSNQHLSVLKDSFGAHFSKCPQDKQSEKVAWATEKHFVTNWAEKLKGHKALPSSNT